VHRWVIPQGHLIEADSFGGLIVKYLVYRFKYNLKKVSKKIMNFTNGPLTNYREN